MTRKDFCFSGSNKEVQIHGILWTPDRKPIAAIQIIHGMTEYVGRYEEMARFFTEEGFAVFGHDIESHGLSERKAPASGEGTLYLSSWASAVEDIETCKKTALEYLPTDIPVIMLGFSLGSFLLRDYCSRYPDKNALCFFVGTGSPKASELRFAKSLIKLMCRDKNKPSELVRSLAFTSYNAKVKHPQSECDWLIVDRKCRDLYLNDKNIHGQMTPAFFLAFLDGMLGLKGAEQGQRTEAGTAVFLSGSDDPVGGKNADGAKLVSDKYRNMGFSTRFISYAGYRHDILHDACRKNVFYDILRLSITYLLGK